MSTPRLIVKMHHPRRTVVRVALALLLVILTLWAVFETGRIRGGLDQSAARAEQERLNGEVQRLERELAELRALLATAERSGQVDQLAHSDLRGLFAEQNDEILSLREELAFYRGIVSPADSRRGLRVHDFTLEPAGGPTAWRYRLVLIQAMQHDRQAQGNARLTLVGTAEGAPARLPLAEVSAQAVDGIPYDFRYFQEFDGDILLPDGFTPTRVEIELIARNARDGRVEQAFDWPGNP
jgi:hypothetical protein